MRVRIELHGHADSHRFLQHRFDIEGIRLPRKQQPAGGMRENRQVRIVHRGENPFGHRVTLHAESGVNRSNHVVEHLQNLGVVIDPPVSKDIEADILADGRVDYDAQILEMFDYVIGSIHSRFSMEGDAMTKRVLTAMDDPHLTILAHPTGRLLLSREPYALDVEAVLEKAVGVGVAVELNADPHRLDLDWRYCRPAKDLGVTIEIGPDAHSVAGLDNVHFGIGLARKAWLEPEDVLNTRNADEGISFARRRTTR